MKSKHPGKEYLITSLPEGSVWEEEARKLLGYRIRVLRPATAIPTDAYLVEILSGPHTGQTLVARGWGLRLAPRDTCCHCASYPFPHRPGGGRCTASNAHAYCGECRLPCDVAQIISDNSPSEAWGVINATPRQSYCSSCCGGEVFSDSKLTTPYSEDIPLC